MEEKSQNSSKKENISASTDELNNEIACSNCGRKSFDYDDYHKEYTCENCGQVEKDPNKMSTEYENVSADMITCAWCRKDRFTYHNGENLFYCEDCGKAANDIVQKHLKIKLIDTVGGESAFKKKKMVMRSRKFTAIIITWLGTFGLIRQLDLFDFYNKLTGGTTHITGADTGLKIGGIIGGLAGLYILYKLIAGPQTFTNYDNPKGIKLRKAFYAFVGGTALILVVTHLIMAISWLIIGVVGGTFDIFGNLQLQNQLNQPGVNILVRNVYNNIFAPNVSYFRLLMIWSGGGAILGLFVAIRVLISSNKKY